MDKEGEESEEEEDEQMEEDVDVDVDDEVNVQGKVFSGNAVPQFGISANIVDVNFMPGLNTRGISIVHVDLEPQGLVLLHMHPQATELTTVINRGLFTSSIIWNTKMLLRLSSLNSQNPGVVKIPGSIFASDPPILDDVQASSLVRK
ncbi:putative germin-like protein 2-2 [Capsicum annuum]|uniref:putative germin-like protein 2-2 n=1 Tax=Capsicum annuum TaxID=4072 RepID=UPI001FB116E2|nr:putative germin-like protein 2-2 [Capsicum annuum]